MGHLGECLCLIRVKTNLGYFSPSISDQKKPQTSGKHMVMCDCSLDMQNIPEKLAQHQICMWDSAPTLINEVRRKMEMLVP